MAESVSIDAVSETLFLPLYALALESRRPDPIMIDEGAVELTHRLNDLFADSDKRIYRRLAQGKLPSTLLTTVSMRIRRFDRYVRDFLAREPDGVVVNLGCGLDDRRRRIDNGLVRWFDLDLPEVIKLRRRFLPETERMRFIASSVLDLTWLDQLPDEAGAKYLFLAEGLFMYLPPDGVRTLVTTLAKRRPGAELVAEVANSRIVRTMQGRFGRGKFRREFGLSADVVYQFGLANSREIEEWAPGLTFLDDWTYYDDDDPKLGMARWFARWSLIRWAQWTVHYRLGTGARGGPGTSRTGGYICWSRSRSTRPAGDAWPVGRTISCTSALAEALRKLPATPVRQRLVQSPIGRSKRPCGGRFASDKVLKRGSWGKLAWS